MASSPPAVPGRPSNTLHFIVGEMSGKLDQVLATLLSDREASNRRFNEVDMRLTTLERWQWRLIGGGSVVVFLIGSVEVWRHGIIGR